MKESFGWAGCETVRTRDAFITTTSVESSKLSRIILLTPPIRWGFNSAMGQLSIATLNCAMKPGAGNRPSSNHELDVAATNAASRVDRIKKAPAHRYCSPRPVMAVR